jgi:hypothetical protein
MKSKTKKIILISLSALVLAITLMIILSPFGTHKDFKYKLVINTIEINAPADSIYSFLGKSSNASKWSVFVNHISPLNSTTVTDGKIGSQRRCFQNADEKGLQWDEEITIAELNKRRQLTIFNMKGFGLEAPGLATEQIYEKISETKTKLSFTLFYINNSPSFLDLFKTYYAAFEVKSIYERNMTNIKNIIETGHK